MELRITKIDKDTKRSFCEVLARKRDSLEAEGKSEKANEADMFLFCLEQADEE